MSPPRTEKDSPSAAEYQTEMLLGTLWLFRKLKLRGSSVGLQEEKLVDELTPEVDKYPTLPGREVPQRPATAG